MLATGRRRAVAGGVVLLLILAALLYFFLTRGGSAAPTAPAHLQVYVGTVQVAPTSGNFSTATNGATLNEGDTVKTLAQSKAAINYSDGSLTRLDSDTTVQLKVIDHPGVSYNTQLAQTTGKSWNRVKALVGGSTFKTDGPNSSTAEARGTDYLFWILPDGTIKVDDFGGSVDFTFAGKTVHLTAGQFSQSAPGGPTTPAPIPAADLKDPFVLFNQAANANPGADQTAIGPDQFLSTGQSSSNQDGYLADGNSDLAFTLNWPGSTFGMTLVGPDGTEYPEQASSTPPYTLVANHALAGRWKYRIHDQISGDKEPWEMVIGHLTPSTGTPQVIFPPSPKKCEYTVLAGETEKHPYQAFSYSGKVSFSATTDLPSKILPDYATLKDNKDGTAEVTFAPPIGVHPSADIKVTVNGTLGGGTASSDCIEHVVAGTASSLGGSVTSGGSGVSGVTLVLTLPDASTTSSVTDSGGNYLFTGLGAGDYTDSLVVPNGYLATGPTSQTETLDGATAGTPLNFALNRFAVAVTSLPNGSVGDPFCSTLSLTGGVAPIAWSVSGGALPAGTSFDGYGHCSGTPVAAGTYNFTLTATDANGHRASQGYTVQILPAPDITVPGGLAISPLDTLRPWDTGFTNPQALAATGGIPPYSWSVAAGSLPNGMSVDPVSGTFSGAPSARQGTYSATIQLTDSVGAKAFRNVIFRIARAPSFQTSLQGNTVRGQPFSQALWFDGGVGPYTVTTSGLAPGLQATTSIEPGEGGPQPVVTVTGTPTTDGTYTPVFTVSDSVGGSVTWSGILLVYFPALSISVPAFPALAVGTPVTLQPTAAGGLGPKAWSASLPTGLSINAQSGQITGSPTQADCFQNMWVQVSDNSTSVYVPIALDVVPAGGAIMFCSTSGSLPSGDISLPYSQQVRAIGGAAPLQYSLSGQVPAGLAVSATDGTLSDAGFQTGQGSTWNFNVNATDGGNNPATKAVSLFVHTPPTLTGGPGPIPLAAGATGTSYQANLAWTSAGTPAAPITPVLESGALPDGLYLYDCSNGTPCLFGTPSVAGSFTFTLDVTDAFGAKLLVPVAYSLLITDTPMTFSDPGPNLPPSMVGDSRYGTGFFVSGGSQPFTWAQNGLPPGLSANFNGSDATISGTPTAAGTYTTTYRVTDSTGATASMAYTIVIDPTLSITTPALPSGDVNVNYSQPITATGGSGGYSFFLLGGCSDFTFGCPGPTGLTINSGTGVITNSGPISAPLTDRVAVEVRDGDGNTASQSYLVTFGPTPAIQTATLPDAAVFSSYCQSLSASEGTPAYTYAVTSGSLPTGVTMDSYGHLTGTPTAAGAFTFTVTATDLAGGTASQGYTVTIS